MAVWIDVLVQGVLYRSVVVPLTVGAQRSVYVALRDLPAGSVAAAADFAERREEIGNLHDAALPAGALAHGGRVRQALAAGQIVTVRQMAPEDMVLRGERVRLLSGGAGIAIEISALAQADARLGQRLPVRLERSNETVMARVISPGVVGVDGR
jgi:flagella basal body P-ring formation protein FlgA